jgi:hypothetical protein
MMMMTARLLKARDAVLAARAALQDTEHCFDCDTGRDASATAQLIAEVRAAEAQLTAANAAVTAEHDEMGKVTREPFRERPNGMPARHVT